jgi:exopolysaccharide production protein ExoQ
LEAPRGSLSIGGPTGSDSSPPVSQLIVSWILMIPLIYFADEGAFSFQRSGINNQLAGSYSALAEGSSGLQTLVICFAVLTLCAAIFFRSLPKIAPSLLRDRLFAILTALALMSTLWSQVPVKTLEWSACLAVNTILAFYLVERFTPERQVNLFLLLGWVCLVSSFAMVIFFPGLGISYLGGFGAWQGMYFHKNFCALSTIFFLSAGLYAPAPTLRQKVGRIIYVGLSAFLIWMTQSRTGWVLACALFLFFSITKILQGLRSRDRVPAIVGFGILAIGGGAFFISNWSTILYAIGKDPTLTGRFDIWQAVLVSIMKRPLTGFGYMGFWRGFEGESANVSFLSDWAVTSSHNGFLEVWVTLGLGGLILLLWTFLRASKHAFCCLVVGATSPVKWYCCVVFLTLLTAIDEVQVLVPNNLMWILYIVACIGLHNAYRKLTETEKRAPARRRQLSAVDANILAAPAAQS